MSTGCEQFDAPDAWREAVAGADEFLTIVDEDDRVVFVNRDGDVAGRDCFSYVEPESHEGMRRAMAGARDTGLPHPFAVAGASPDGATSVRSWAVPIRNTPLLAIVSVDLSHPRNLEQALPRYQALFRSLTASFPGHFAVVNTDYRIEFASRAAGDVSPDEQVGRRVDDFAPLADRASVLQALDQVFATGEPATLDSKLEVEGSPLRYFHTAIAPIAGLDGSIHRVLALGTDVTDARIAERERIELEERLRHAQKIDALGSLTGGVAHDFNNLLMMMRSNLEVALDEGDLQVARAQVRETLEAVDRAAALTRHLLAFGRRQTLAPRRVDLNALVAVEVPMLGRTIGEQYRIETHLGPLDGSCRIDPTQLQNAIINLVVNARDAMTTGGTITITTTEEEREGRSWARLSVRDEGVGMSPEVIEKAITPFFSTKHTSGLGLSMVHGFVHQTGGTMEIESREGVGTAVCLVLPLDRHPPSLRPAPRHDVPRPTRSDGVILVVEDDPGVRRATDKLIRSAGFRCIAVGSAEDAVDLIDAGEPFDILLSDVVLPGMDGATLARRVAVARPDVTILLMSGYAADILGEETPAEAPTMLVKPFSRDELLQAIEQMRSS